MSMRDLWLAVLIAAATLGVPVGASATQPASPTVPTERAPSQVVHVVTDEEQDAERYAEMEAASEQASDFEGGRRGAYIGVSSGVIIAILLVVLLVVLL
jgi:hypothetical protein